MLLKPIDEPRGIACPKPLSRQLSGNLLSLTGAATRAAGDLMVAIVHELKKSGKFTLPSFGTFTVRKMKAGKALNPRTGEPVKVRGIRFLTARN
jgi:DNA-binding protein HU-beta